MKYKTPDGVWKQRTFARGKEDEAQKFDAECAYDETDNARMTLVEAVLVYLKNVQHCRETTMTYRYVITYLARHLQSRFVDTLTRRDLESVRDNARESGCKPSTINHYVGKLKAALNWCAEQDLIPENPWAQYRALPAKTVHRTGEYADFLRVYAELPEWMRWACRTAMALCLRPGVSELFRLQWSAFDWDVGCVRVRMPKVDDVKTVYAPAAYLTEARQRFEADGKDATQYVCRSRTGRLVQKKTYQKAWYRACSKVNVKMPPYAMRHIAASEMLAGGADLAAVAAQLGHRSIQTTASVYTHAVAGAQQRAALVLPLVQR
ncbi:MAG: site-specific integrase [Desulfovibrio sp.]|nr:site-specific integrase [Desulfovibrio sp.]